MTLRSHVYLEEEKAWQGAEQALRFILVQEPGNKEALQNLSILQTQQKAP